MEDKKSQGFLIFAQNNSTVNYLQIALANALLIKKHLNKPVTIVTDSVSLRWEQNIALRELIEDTFDQIIIQENDPSFVNARQYRDTIYHGVIDNFNNKTRSTAYNLSPYDETVLLDADYLIFDDSLNNVWSSFEDILINDTALDLNGKVLDGQEYRLSDSGIRMYWATCIYFKKCEGAQLMFEMVEHVRANWDWYQCLYDFPGTMYRNDYAFSIAIHTMNGFVEGKLFNSLPTPYILSLLDTDQVYKYLGNDKIQVFVNSKTENWKFDLANIKGMSIHIMNKLSLIPQLSAIIEELRNEIE